MENKDKQYVSVAELAKLIGISRVAVFKQIKKGQIPAEKVGRSYVISTNYVNNLTKGDLTEVKKKEIEQAVEKVVEEYGETLKLLGKE